KELGAKALKINIVSCVSRGETMKSKGELLSNQEILEMREVVYDLEKKHNYNIILDIPPAFKPLSRLKGRIGMCGIKRMIGILSDGKVSICGIGSNVEELVFGDISKDSIADIWNNNEILKMLREELPEKLEGICGKCILKYCCLGKCRAAAFWTSRSLFSPFEFCQEIYESGLFPGDMII
ncbi:SPASM domain-containing protein, partial [Elusimicrobiota bacterium]